MASTQDYLNLISQYESGNQNKVNYLYGQLTPQGLPQTAQGYYQITNQNWNNVAPLLGIDTSVYPNAMSAPQSVQAQVASYLLTQTPAGISNWSNYNPQLASALAAAGMQTSGTVSDLSVAPGGPLVDLSGAAATTPTASILNQLDTSVGNALGVDPATAGGLLLAAGIAAAWVLLSGR